MALNLTQLAYQALRDLGCLRPGQTTSADVLADILAAANEVIDQWALERLFVLYGAAPGTTLTSFPDLTTSYALAPGYAEALRSNIAARIYPMMIVYLKIPAPSVSKADIESEAARTKAALRGLGVA